MLTQLMGLVGPLGLCALFTPPADAQDEGGFEGSQRIFFRYRSAISEPIGMCIPTPFTTDTKS